VVFKFNHLLRKKGKNLKSISFFFMNKRFSIIDVFILIFLLLSTGLFAVIFVDFSLPPKEDAAILMRYALHFAKGYGIVWNIGEKPVDGATDFLFMILVGCFVKAGLSLEFATRFIGFLSHIITVCIIYITLRKLFFAGFLPSILSSLYLAVGPGLYYVAACFGTTFFALWASISWYLALSIIVSGETRNKSLMFAISSFVTALIRPEGVILTVLMLISILYVNGIKKSRFSIYFYIGIFLFLGGLYFFWRWHYFGFPLPNTFYKKFGSIDLKNLLISVKGTIVLCLPFLPSFIIGLYSPRTLRLNISFLIPFVGFVTVFIMISQEMNYLFRYQYILLPIALMCWWPLVGAIKDDFHFPKWNQLNLQRKIALMLFITGLGVGAICYQLIISRYIGRYYRDGRYDVALILSSYKDKYFIIATTEAGLLPLYSGWKTLDTWGLNDQWIAHNGGITEEYLSQFQPHIIMFHATFSPLVPCQGNGAWFRMLMTLKRYAEKHKYVLAAVFGDSPYDTHYYYVRSDFPESEEIINRIRAIDYWWGGTGRKAINYALLASK
jgi:arabinofuranosyltransferase